MTAEARYRAHGFEVVLKARSLTIRPAASTSTGLYRDGRWAVFLALLAVARARGDERMLVPTVLRSFVPWNESALSSIGLRVRKQWHKWESLGLRPIDFTHITAAWRLSPALKVTWVGTTAREVEAQFSVPGLSVWQVATEEGPFSIWLVAMVRAGIAAAAERVATAEWQLRLAERAAPNHATRAGVVLERVVLRHGRSKAQDQDGVNELAEMERLGGPIGQAVRLHRLNLELLDARTESVARQLLSDVESQLHQGIAELGSGPRSSLFASAALAWRRSGAYDKARASAGAAIVAGFVARDLRAVYRGIGELLLAGYQDRAFRESNPAWRKWALAALKLEKHMPVLRDSFVTPLVVARALAYQRRVRWARRLLSIAQRQIEQTGRQRDVALAAACHATLCYAEASLRVERGERLALKQTMGQLTGAYRHAIRLHQELNVESAWFADEFPRAEGGELFRFTK